MALYNIDVEKRLGSEYWTNRYITDMDSMAEGVTLGNDIVGAELLIHSELVTITKYRVSEGAGEAYTIVTVGEPGLNEQTNLLPLFNTLRFDLPAATGRPSRKFYRGVLGESDINGDAVQSTYVTFAAALSALLKPDIESQGIVDPQGQFLTGVVQWPFVQMRQLRRGTRKRGTPIFL